MTTAEMVATVKYRTKQPDDAKILDELRSAYRWAAMRIFNAQGGPDLLSTIGQELAIAATTRDYNLGANVTGELLGIKQLWLKMTGDTIFTKMCELDESDARFVALDSSATSTPDVAVGHPVAYFVYNFDQVRFAPALPAGSTLRADFYRLAAPPDPTTNPTATSGNDLPGIFHDAMVAKATAHCFSNLDDTRVGEWETRARDFFNDAILVANSRVQQPTQTQPWGRGRRR